MAAAELEKLCQMVRSVGSGNEPVEPERRFSQRTVGEGVVRMTVTVTADEAAVVCAALDSFAEAPARRAEGLVARRSRGDVPPLALRCGRRAAPLRSNRPNLDVGRRPRTIPAAIRRAMSVRDGGCRLLGCSQTIVDGHHIEHWISGGETKLHNLVSLCRRHHRFTQEGGAVIEFRFRTRDGGALSTDFRVVAVIPRRSSHVSAEGARERCRVRVAYTLPNFAKAEL